MFRFGRWIVVDDVVEEAPAIVTAPTPGPCTCLTKNYTPSGLVVFADVCTKESASASVYSSSDASQAPTTPVAATAVPMTVVPTTPSYAGRTYDDYLAANPQAANPAPRLRRRTEDGGQRAEHTSRSKTEIACGSTAGDLFFGGEF